MVDDHKRDISKLEKAEKKRAAGGCIATLVAKVLPKLPRTLGMAKQIEKSS